MLALTACTPPESDHTPPILLFNEIGTSPNDIKAVEAILKERRLKYATMNSRQLNSMSEPQLLAYHLMIIPGGNYISMGNSLTPTTTTNIHNAVQGALNYLGICAGAEPDVKCAIQLLRGSESTCPQGRCGDCKCWHTGA